MDIKVLDPTGIYWTCNFCIEYWESLTIYLNKSKCLFWTRLVYINLWKFHWIFPRYWKLLTRCSSWTPLVSTNLEINFRMWSPSAQFGIISSCSSKCSCSIPRECIEDYFSCENKNSDSKCLAWIRPECTEKNNF